MKKIFGIIFIVYLSNVAAQSFYGGVKIGLVGTQISGDNLSGYNKPGPIIGGTVGHYVDKKTALQMELYYIQKGSKNPKIVDTSAVPGYRLRMDYMEMPIIFRRHFTNYFAFEGGASGAILFHVYEGDYNGNWAVGLNGFHRFDVSGKLGFLFHLTERWNLSLRYSGSLLPVRPHSSGATYQNNFGQYHDIVGFSMFYIFPLAK